MDRARTVVVSGVPGHVLPPSRTADKLTIHFQSRRTSHGGDVSEVTYPTSMAGVAFVTFDHPEDAAKVVKKKRQILTDGVFPKGCLLTVFPFSSDVFLYVSTATVDLSSIEGDQSSLIESLRSAHRSLRFRPLPQRQAAEIEGPFAAIRALRTDLLRKITGLEPDSNPKGAAHPEASVSLAASEAKEPTASGGLSGRPQRTGEASGAQSLLPKWKTPKDCLTQTASGGDLPVSFWKSDTEDGLKTLAKYRTSSLRRQVVGEESDPRFLPPMSDLKSFPAEDVKRQKDPIRPENYPAAKHMKGLSRSEVPRVKGSTGSDGEGTKWSSSREGRRDVCLDSYTFRYVEKFYKTELEACLSGVTAGVKHLEEPNLLKVSLTAAPNSPGGPGPDEASEKLEKLMSYWQSKLSIYQADFNETGRNGEDKLAKICKDVGATFASVLYVVENRCVKVVGLPLISRVAYEEIKYRVARL